jgi:hypothetical protein
MSPFVLVNECTDPNVTPDLLAAIATALDVQANRDAATYWGGNYRVRAATPNNPPDQSEIIAVIVDDLPQDPNAVADHVWQGRAGIFAARNMCVSLVDGTYSLSQALSHEILEALGDEACNEWKDDGAGAEWANELCDPVEAGWYLLPGNIAGSDFVLPAWFEPGALGPYSFIQSQHNDVVPAAPFTIAPGGYALKRTPGSDIIQVTGEIRADRMAKKSHWSARTWRRGWRPQPVDEAPTPTPAEAA